MVRGGRDFQENEDEHEAEGDVRLGRGDDCVQANELDVRGTLIRASCDSTIVL